ncbi:hypothetical protein MTO96_037347 [Rhipicephalus appendiculatus]
MVGGWGILGADDRKRVESGAQQTMPLPCHRKQWATSLPAVSPPLIESFSAACGAIYRRFRATGVVVTWRVLLGASRRPPPTSVEGKLASLVVHFLPIYRSPCLSGSAGQMSGGRLLPLALRNKVRCSGVH